MNLTMDGTGLGTPEYIAPEQFSGAKDVDCRSDVYGLGVTLYTILTGKLPFVGKSNIDKLMAKVNNQFRPPEEFNPGITAMTRELIKRSIDADPAQRPATAGQFATEALDCLNPACNPQAVAGAWEAAAEQGAFWHVVLPGDAAQPHRLKATEVQLAAAIADRRIDAAARVSRHGLEPTMPIGQAGSLGPLLEDEPILMALVLPEPSPLARLWQSIRRIFGGR